LIRLIIQDFEDRNQVNNMSNTILFGVVVRVRNDKTFVIKMEGKPYFFSTCCDASSVFENSGKVINFSNRAPRKLYKARSGDRVVFQINNEGFVVSWAPKRKFISAKNLRGAGVMACAKIGRRKFVGTPAKVVKLIRFLAPKDEDVRMRVFSR
jgi:hypothetical protein